MEGGRVRVRGRDRWREGGRQDDSLHKHVQVPSSFTYVESCHHSNDKRQEAFSQSLQTHDPFLP